MGSNIESVEVRFCDICGQKNDDTHHIMKCWRCGKDCCDQHFHLVHVQGAAGKFITYLCDPDRDEMKDKLQALFQDFSLDRARRPK